MVGSELNCLGGFCVEDRGSLLIFIFSFLSFSAHPLQYSCLENPRDRGAWWAAIYGVAQSQTRLKQFSSSSHHRMQLSNCRLRKYFWGVSWWSCSLDFILPWQWAQVSSLIGELRYGMLRAKKYLFNDISNNIHHVLCVSEQHSDCTNISVAQ